MYVKCSNYTKFEGSTLKNGLRDMQNVKIGHYAHILWTTMLFFDSLRKYFPIYLVSKNKMYTLNYYVNCWQTDKWTVPYHNTCISCLKPGI